ncbi:glycoside hydrolase family 55 protein [Rhizobium sp. VS19-DR104.2]|uniref:glycoside hydrolase family 55 protein n=1 Tax=unclassified Rhizobium TaxID=2613769 RepID=UPI001CC6E848|nr:MULTISPECIES: glycoside hydrolase family 55 protein [unclassified Rhizobium]MBZ5757956.1 glycoside hydrolase family 55 protein [Rhizobium sp. VS19-DR96]MBZ5765214.1 glycoside hydrolase family 55 protein [Rhizobium sp. VS19-DR129.2]MBZ5772757.1 glycoside hydrolase family 55 protein [Rhizobium sp. VS19-DRK62.2]MBZ5782556.1 glycoside hydrolase family 55 protein [Rhizobium sp. VS19-DR121]MBZ5800004.1 glycoside hydrolase family 55 protein [Rhizobium sp. VS19-DR181]
MSNLVPTSVLAPFTLVAAPALRTTDARFWDKPSIRDFDVGDTDQGFSLQSAINAGASNKKSVYIPAGDYTVATGVTLSSAFGVQGDGDGRSTITTVDFNGPLFSILTTGTSIENSFMKNLNARAYFTSDAVAGDNAAFLEYANGSPNYIQHNKFKGIGIEGFPAGFRDVATTGETGFGRESYVNWTRYEDIRITTFSRSVKVAFDFRAGSGTGNVFTGFDTNVGGRDADGVSRPGTVMRVGGVGCVVGDIIISNSHLGGYPGSVLFEGAVGTVYRQRIGVVGSQLDAGLDYAFSLDAAGVEWTNLVFNGNNVGGNAHIADNMPAIRSSIIDDQNVSHWRSGHFVKDLPTGPQTIQFFDVAVGDYDGTFLTITASGLVPGVSGGVTIWRGTISRTSANGVISVLDNNIQNPANAAFFVIGVAPASYGARVTVALAPTSAGGYVDAQIQAIGGKVKIVRI